MNSIASSNSNSTRENSFILYKDKALALINKEEVNEKELLSYSKELINLPIIEPIVEKSLSLFNQDSFEIFKKEKVNPAFIRNLLNIIEIINFIWLASKKKINIFHQTLMEIGIIFAFVYRNEKDTKNGIDYVLLSPLPNIVFDIIAKYGKKCFDEADKFDFNDELFSINDNKKQIGIIYQESSIVQILSNFDLNKLIICPKIMYYLQYNFSKYLFNNKILNVPMNFLELTHEEKKKYSGYNEIDLSFSILENVEIAENFAFNATKLKNNEFIIKNYDGINKNKIIFEKDSNIFIELKSSIKNLDINSTIENFKKISNRFSSAYKNFAYSKIDNKLKKDKISYYLFYNDNKLELFNKIDYGMKLPNDIEIWFNSANVQLLSIVSLQNQIREINEKIDSQNNEIFQLHNKIYQLNNEIIKQNNENEKNILINEYKFAILDLKYLNIKEDSLIKIIEKYKNNKSINIFAVYHECNKLFLKAIDLFEKINTPEGLIILNDQIIGLEEPPENYLYFIELLEKKIKGNTFAKKYYISYKNTLTGKDYISTNKKICHYLICEKEISNILKNIFKFIYFLDSNPELLNFLYGSILFYTVIIAKYDNKYLNIYNNLLDTDIEKSIISIIETINPTFIKN